MSQKSQLCGFLGMSSFASTNLELPVGQFSLELKTHNSRSLDCVCSLPESNSRHEPQLRAILAEYFKRGRIELRIKYVAGSAQLNSEAVSAELVDHYLQTYRNHCQRLNLAAIAESEFVAQTIFLFSREASGRGSVLDLAWSTSELTTVVQTVRELSVTAIEQRQSEGFKIKQLFELECLQIDKILRQIESLLDAHKQDLKIKFESRLAEIPVSSVQVDSNRLHQELAIIWQRSDFAEELDRARHFLREFSQSLVAASPIGRRLEFLIQELGREINTMGAKAQNAEIQMYCVELKCALDRIREQVLNLE